MLVCKLKCDTDILATSLSRKQTSFSCQSVFFHLLSEAKTCHIYMSVTVLMQNN